MTTGLKGMMVLSVMLLMGAGCSYNGAVTSKMPAAPEGAMMESDGKMMKDDSDTIVAPEDAMMESESMKKDGDNMDAMEKDSSAMIDVSADVIVATKGTYTTYDESKLANAKNGTVVLFFHAGWCPSCKALNSDIEANVASIPSGLTILKTDYDKETALKKKYGVTYQHTMVQVDAEGNLIKKWSGKNTLKELVANVGA